MSRKDKRRDYTIELDDLKLALSEWGPTTGTPFLAFHGWLDNMNTYLPMIEQSDWLEKNNIRLICVDWPGHGFSEHRPKGHSYPLLEYVQNLHDLIENLALPEVNLLGHSLGGSIATLYCGTFPEKVNQLILIEGLGPLTLSAKEAPQQLAKAILQRYKNKGQQRQTRYYESIEPIVKARAFNNDLSSENARLLVERNLRQTEDGYVWRSDHRLKLASYQLLSHHQVDAYIENLTMPVLLIYGEDGFVKRFPSINEMVKKYQHVSAVKVKGGHHLHMQYPQATVDLIIKFYNKNKKIQ